MGADQSTLTKQIKVNIKGDLLTGDFYFYQRKNSCFVKVRILNHPDNKFKKVSYVKDMTPQEFVELPTDTYIYNGKTDKLVECFQKYIPKDRDLGDLLDILELELEMEKVKPSMLAKFGINLSNSIKSYKQTQDTEDELEKREKQAAILMLQSD